MQAHRELQKVLGDPSAQLPADASALFANRIKFVMVGEVAKLLDPANPRPALIVVDEAHHAAAPSYAPIFDASWMVPVLLLTATPNRNDRLPLGMDEIAFTITYRELAERTAIIIPQFEDFPVDNFDWSVTALGDLVDYIIDRPFQPLCPRSLRIAITLLKLRHAISKCHRATCQSPRCHSPWAAMKLTSLMVAVRSNHRLGTSEEEGSLHRR